MLAGFAMASLRASEPPQKSTSTKSKERAEGTAIAGVEVGMTLQQAVEAMGRIPNSKRVGEEAKPPKGSYARPPLEPDGILFWRQPDESIVEVGIRNDHVLYAGILYAKNRRSSDFALPAWSTDEERRWGLELQPPVGAFRVRRTPGPLSPGTRVIWDRREKRESDFTVEIAFTSPLRGDSSSYTRQVASKRVSVTNEDQKKFDAWVATKAK